MSRDHQPIVIEEFNGLWVRGDREAVPPDHFSDCANIVFIESGFQSREGIATYPVGTNPSTFLSNVMRIYTYVHGAIESLLVLDDAGNIFDTGSPTPTVAILTVIGMTDFAFVNINGRAYISPHDGNLGLANEFLYVYKGDGLPARKAAGDKPTGTMVAANGGAGNVEAGIHIFGVVYETDTGFLTALGPDTFPTVTAPGNAEVDLSSIPVSPDTFVIARRIVATKAIDPAFYTGNTEGYQFFFVPGGRIPDNVATTLAVNFYDADLLADASHLFDLYSEIPAGVALNTYHNRLINCAQFGIATTDPLTDESYKWSTALVSYPGEPEAISQVDGFIISPLDGNPLTNAQEYRDVLYLFKSTRTFSYNDNGDASSTWPLTIIDQGVGASVHGIANVLDSGGVNVEYLIIVDYSGVMLFNGTFQRPELSYKIKDYWLGLDRSFFEEIQIVNDSISQIVFMTLPNQRMLIGDYTNGLTPKSIKWAIWTFENQTTTITLIDTNKLIIGSIGIP